MTTAQNRIFIYGPKRPAKDGERNPDRLCDGALGSRFDGARAAK